MELTWLRTAGFIVKTKEGEIAFDPFLSRGKGVPSPFGIGSFQNTQAIFVGHGHFDHTYDIPNIVKETNAKVFSPGLTAQLLKLRGVTSDRIMNASNDEILFQPFKVRAFKSSHVTFDFQLVLSTMKRCGVGGCLNVISQAVGYPKGTVQTYLFESGGKKFLFVSSAGCSDEELKMYRKLEVDFFLAPLQGHSAIQEIAAYQASIIQPKVVIPHHHDDFFPPLSQSISVEGFRDQLKHKGYRGDVLEIPLFQSAQV